MSSTVVKSPGPFSFMGNPMIYEVSATDNRQVGIQVVVDGETYMQSYYPFKSSSGNYRCKIDISALLYKKAPPAKFDEGSDLVSELNGHAVSYTSRIYLIDNNNSPYSLLFEGTVLPGGVNDQVSACLQENGKDIFSARLRNYSVNFLFTTRTHGRVIRIKESEMYPFLFIHPGEAVTFRSAGGNDVEAPMFETGSICLMDIYKIWDRFVSEFTEVPRKIEVLVDAATAFTFLISEGIPAGERYKIRFRNSLGAFEVLEITGVASHEPEQGEETTWKELTDSNFYENRRDRVPVADVIKVETGYKSKDDLLFIRDLIGSDEAYFYYPDGTSFRCTVKADKMAYREKKVSPTSVALVVTEVGTGKYVSPELDRESLGGLGIYNETFDETYGEDFR